MSFSKKIKHLVIVAFSFVAVAVLALPAAASDFGLSYGASLGLPTQDLRITVFNIVNILLGFLGVLAVLLIIYAGLIWMTAGGNEDKIEQAKKIITNAVIGLVIIFLSVVIVSYLINQLSTVLGDGAGTQCTFGVDTTRPCGPSNCGTQTCQNTNTWSGCDTSGPGCNTTTINQCFVNSSQPNTPAPRNAVVRFNLNNASLSGVDGTTVIISKSDGTTVAGTVTIDNRDIVFIPSAACPPPGPVTEKCFEADTQYTADITAGAGVIQCGGHGLNCTNGKCQKTFTTNQGFDVTPPIIQFGGQQICQSPTTVLSAFVSDDTGISRVDFTNVTNPGSPVFILADATVGNPDIASINWDTSGLTVGTTVQVEAKAFDLDNHQPAVTAPFTIHGASCCNLVQDNGEAGVDCGGTSSCEPCNPVIEWVWPLTASADSLVTIHGRHFGTYTAGTSAVYFSATPPTADPSINAPLARTVNAACSPNDWSDMQAIVVVPSGAGNGPLKLTGQTATGAASDRTDQAPGGAISNFTVDPTVSYPGLCSVNPATGLPDAAVTLNGLNFPTSNFDVTFAQLSVGGSPAVSADKKTITGGRVPPLDQGLATVHVTDLTSGKKSNPFIFAVQPTTTPTGGQCVQNDAAVAFNGSTDGASVSAFNFPIGNQFSIELWARPERTGATETLIQWLSSAGAATIAEIRLGPSVNTWQVTLRQGVAAATQTQISGSFNFQVNQWYHFVVVVDTTSGTGQATVYINGTVAAGPVALKAGGFTLTSGLLILGNRGGLQRFQGSLDDLGFYTKALSGSDVSQLYQNIQPAENALLNQWRFNGTLTAAKGGVNGAYNPAGNEHYSLGHNACSTSTPPPGVGTACDGDNDPNNNSCTVDKTKCPSNGLYCDPGSCTCQSTTSIAKDSTYSWFFQTTATGPQVVETCNRTGSCSPYEVSSPSPFNADGTRYGGFQMSGARLDDGAVAVDAIVSAILTEPILPASLNSNTIKVFKCNSSAANPVVTGCSLVAGTLTTGNNCFYNNQSVGCFGFQSSANLTPDTWYLVDLDAANIIGENGAPLGGNDSGSGHYKWIFKTRPSSASSIVGCLYVQPPQASLYEYDEQKIYTAQPTSADNRCVNLRADVCTTYGWGIGTTHGDPAAAVAVADSNPADNSFTAAARKTTVPDWTSINAICSTPAGPTSGVSQLFVDFLSPHVIDKFPNCGTGCLNSLIGAKFSKQMDPASMAADKTMELYICFDDSTCTLGSGSIASEVSDYNPVSTDGQEYAAGVTCYDAAGNVSSDPNKIRYCLLPNTYYRVVVRDTAKSVSSGVGDPGRPLVGLNYDDPAYSTSRLDSYSWVFKTQAHFGLCYPSVISLDPQQKSSPVNQTIIYSSQPKTAPDQCAPVVGQRLNPYLWSWNWNSVQSTGWSGAACNGVNSSPFKGRYAADWLSTQAGGSAGLYCANASSALRDACGNGVIELGEDCDDGNTVSGDGCSYPECLHQGSNAAYGSTCGNNLVEQGEDCDDGNTVSDPTTNDYCGATCLWTGNTDYNLEVCGNSIIDLHEECDPAGPGCSADCRLTGSVSGQSLCGDGSIGLGEECDMGERLTGRQPSDADGDNCSATCLIQDPSLINYCRSSSTNQFNFRRACLDNGGCGSGTSCIPLTTATGVTRTVGSTCGNGAVEQGEECDTGTEPNGNNGDGCSDRCLRSGSVYERGPLDGAAVGPYQIASTLKNGTAVLHAWIASLAPNGGPFGEAQLTIGTGGGETMGVPVVIDRWPDCGSACVNSAIGAQFSTSTEKSTLSTANIILYQCGNDTACPPTSVGVHQINGIGIETLTISAAAQVKINGNDQYDAFGISLPSLYNPVDTDQNPLTPPVASLLPNTYYRVIIRRDVISDLRMANGGQFLAGLNFNDPTWTPAAGNANDPDSYSWVFKTKADAAFCTIDRVQVIPDRLSLPEDGARHSYFSQPWSRADACSQQGQRLNAYQYNWAWGQAPLDSVDAAFVVTPLADGCGNGVIEPGEDCDRTAANNQFPVGCSNACQWQGTAAPICGNGVIDPGEECDDSNLTLNNGYNGGIPDYCGANCLLIGNTNSQTHPAVCGDAVVETGEECDTGFAGLTNDADGCTVNCRYTGAIPGSGSLCGDGQISLGEECDGNELASGGTPLTNDAGGCSGVSGDYPANPCVAAATQPVCGDAIHLDRCYWTGTACKPRPCILEIRNTILSLCTADSPTTPLAYNFSALVTQCPADFHPLNNFNLASLAGNNDWNISVCGNGLAEKGEQCDDGGLCQDGANKWVSCTTRDHTNCAAGSACQPREGFCSDGSGPCASIGAGCGTGGQCISDGCSGQCVNNSSAADDNRIDPYQIAQTRALVTPLTKVREEIRAWSSLQPDRVGTAELTVVSGGTVPFAVIGHQPPASAQNECRNVGIWAIFSQGLNVDSLKGVCRNDATKSCLQSSDCGQSGGVFNGLSLVGSAAVGPAADVYPSSVVVQGTYAYIVNSVNHEGLTIFDVSNPVSPTARGYIAITSPNMVAVNGDFAYTVSSGAKKLSIFDVSNKNTISPRGTISTNLSQPNGVAVAGRYAYVVNGNIGGTGTNSLAIFDVSNKGSIVAKGTISTNLSGSISVAVAGHYAYVANITGNSLAIFDVTDPDHIIADGTITDQLSGPVRLAVNGNYVYVANLTNNRLVIFDVSDHEHPRLVGSTDEGLLQSVAVAVAGPYAYVASNGNGQIVVFDITNPAAPKKLANQPTTQPANLAVVGSYIYAVGRQNSFQIFTPNISTTAQLCSFNNFIVDECGAAANAGSCAAAPSSADNIVTGLAYHQVSGTCNTTSHHCVFADAGEMTDSFCATSTDCRGSKVEVTATQAGFLSANTHYKVFVRQNQTDANNPLTALKDVDGDSLNCLGPNASADPANRQCAWDFSTNADFCTCDYVGVTVANTSAGNQTVKDVFTCADNSCGSATPDDTLDDDIDTGNGGNQHGYGATCYDISNPQQAIIPLMANPQTITFSWLERDPDKILFVSNFSGNPNQTTDRSVTPGNAGIPAGRNGRAAVIVVGNQYRCQKSGLLCINDGTPDGNCAAGTGPCQAQESAVQRVNVTTFMCSSPWTFSDNSAANCAPGAGVCRQTNFDLFYCRDNGKPIVADDLPALGNAIIRRDEPTSPELKDFIFPVVGASDAIGIRVLPNPLHLSPEVWYRSGLCGGAVSIENVCFSPADCGSSQVIVPGLIGYWNMDETSGSTVTDSANSSNGQHNGTITNAAHVAGRKGNGLQFSGNGYVEVTNIGGVLNGNKNDSVSLWFKTAALNGRLFGQDEQNRPDHPNAVDGIALTMESGLLCGKAGNDFVPEGTKLCSTKQMADNAWHHAAIVRGPVPQWYRDQNSLPTPIPGIPPPTIPGWENLAFGQLYVDGELVAQGLSGGSNNDGGISVKIGADYEVQSYFTGVIDEVKLFNRPLTADEATSLYHEIAGGQQCKFNVPTKGSPQSIVVDGYRAVRDGRSIYVDATNLDASGGLLYSNIYILSYSQSAGPNAVEIFNRLLDASGQHGFWTFNTNVANDRVCTDVLNPANAIGRFEDTTTTCDPAQIPQYATQCAAHTSAGQDVCNADGTNGCQWSDESNSCVGRSCEPVVCSSDFDCPNFHCSAEKAKIVRDAKRYADLRDIQIAIKKAGAPRLAGGTYINGISFSVWPSWQQTFGPALKTTIAQDPLNKLIACPGYYCDPNRNNAVDPGETTVCNPVDRTLVACGGNPCIASDTDQARTCWDEIGKKFSCPANARSYAYGAGANANDYLLFTRFEYDAIGSWRTRPISYCDGPPYNLATYNNGVLDPAEKTALNVCTSRADCVNTVACLADTLSFYPFPATAVVGGGSCQLFNFEVHAASIGGGSTAVTGCGAGNDTDNDGICNATDNCSTVANRDQRDSNGNGLGDACDPGCSGDADADGVCDNTDSCRTVFNPVTDVCAGFRDSNNQCDVDFDGIGDACDPCSDLDRDGAWDVNTPANDRNICPRDNVPSGYCTTIPMACVTNVDCFGVGSCIFDPVFAQQPIAKDHFLARDRFGFCLNTSGQPQITHPCCLSNGIYSPATCSNAGGRVVMCASTTGANNDCFDLHLTAGYDLKTYNPLQEDFDNDLTGYIGDSCIDYDKDGFGDWTFYHKTAQYCDIDGDHIADPDEWQANCAATCAAPLTCLPWSWTALALNEQDHFQGCQADVSAFYYWNISAGINVPPVPITISVYGTVYARPDDEEGVANATVKLLTSTGAVVKQVQTDSTTGNIGVYGMSATVNKPGLYTVIATYNAGGTIYTSEPPFAIDTSTGQTSYAAYLLIPSLP